MKRLVLITTVLASLGFVSFAHADDHHHRCGNVPIADWMSEADLRTKIEPLGLQIRDVYIDDGCYEVKARNKDGRKLEIKFNPQTGDQVWIDGDDD